jgi:hypothetical protein
MLFFGGGFGLIAIAVWIFCVIDTIVTPAEQCRNLPKLAWVFIVLLFLDIGSIAWLVAGRPWTKVPAARSQARLHGFGAGPAARRPVATNPDDDEEFLASLRRRTEEQRRRTHDERDGGDADGLTATD